MIKIDAKNDQLVINSVVKNFMAAVRRNSSNVSSTDQDISDFLFEHSSYLKTNIEFSENAAELLSSPVRKNNSMKNIPANIFNMRFSYLWYINMQKQDLLKNVDSEKHFAWSILVLNDSKYIHSKILFKYIAIRILRDDVFKKAFLISMYNFFHDHNLGDDTPTNILVKKLKPSFEQSLFIGNQNIEIALDDSACVTITHEKSSTIFRVPNRCLKEICSFFPNTQITFNDVNHVTISSEALAEAIILKKLSRFFIDTLSVRAFFNDDGSAFVTTDFNAVFSRMLCGKEIRTVNELDNYACQNALSLTANLTYFHLQENLAPPVLGMDSVIRHVENIITPSHQADIMNNGLIFGRHNNPMGIGEDARMFKSALDYQGYTTHKVDSDGPSEHINAIAHFKLSCMPAWDYAIERLRHPSFDFYPVKHIGYCPWELPTLPKPLVELFSPYDEIWVNSQYVYDAFAPQLGGKVHVLSAPVIVDWDDHLFDQSKTRQKWGLRHDAFCYLVMFDCNSSLNRKNPWLPIKAFLDISKNNSDIQLCVKVMNGHINIPHYRELLSLCQDTPSIVLIEEILEKHEIYALISSVDVYISAHRSEGFGRIIAEAMLLNTQVIASKYSGNLDFCNSDTALLIDGKIIPTKPDDYYFAEGQEWFDPDFSSLKDQMHKATSQDDKKIKIARNSIINQYSAESISAQMISRLHV